MDELVKTIVNAPTGVILTLCGLALLFIAVFGRITDRLDPGPVGRIAAGCLGIPILVAGLFLFGNDAPRETGPPPFGSPTGPRQTATGADTPLPGDARSPDAAPMQPEPHRSVVVPADQVVRRPGKTYTILKMEITETGMRELTLDVRARVSNESDYPANFWSDNFRLMVDGALQAPANLLNELVAAHSIKEGTVAFTLPPGAKSVSLQIDRFGPDAPGIEIPLPKR